MLVLLPCSCRTKSDDWTSFRFVIPLSLFLSRTHARTHTLTKHTHTLSTQLLPARLFFSHSLEKVWKSLSLVQVGIAGTTLSLSLSLTFSAVRSCEWLGFSSTFHSFLKIHLNYFVRVSLVFKSLWYLSCHNVQSEHGMKKNSDDFEKFFHVKSKTFKSDFIPSVDWINRKKYFPINDNCLINNIT